MQISGCCFSANKRSNVSATLYTRNGRRRRNGELRLSRGEEEGGRRDGETVAKGDPRVSQIFLHDRLSNLPTRCAVEFRQHRLECETERATGFIVSARSHEDLAPQLSKCSTVESVVCPNYETKDSTRMHLRLVLYSWTTLVSRPGKFQNFQSVVFEMNEEKDWLRGEPKYDLEKWKSTVETLEYY